MKRALTLVAIAWPAPVCACAVCGANGANQANFLGSTLFLSLLPLVMIGGGLLWLRSRVRAARRRWAGPAPESAARPGSAIEASGAMGASRPQAAPGR